MFCLARTNENAPCRHGIVFPVLLQEKLFMVFGFIYSGFSSSRRVVRIFQWVRKKQQIQTNLGLQLISSKNFKYRTVKKRQIHTPCVRCSLWKRTEDKPEAMPQNCECPANSPHKLWDAVGWILWGFVWNIFIFPEILETQKCWELLI